MVAMNDLGLVVGAYAITMIGTAAFAWSVVWRRRRVERRVQHHIDELGQDHDRHRDG